jgi:hypothetical protein
MAGIVAGNANSQWARRGLTGSVGSAGGQDSGIVSGDALNGLHLGIVPALCYSSSLTRRGT